MQQKKYIDIVRLKDKYAKAFTIGERIVCQEKLDGSNAAIAYDMETGTLKAFSRRQELSADNTLQGFYNYVQALDAEAIGVATKFGKYIIFGEWLVAHTIHYPEDKMHQFYVFDMWNTETEEYMPWNFVAITANMLGLKTVPLFYEGEFTSWEDVYKFVGKTQMDAEPTGEGIVIKSQDRLDNKFSGTPAYVKIVAKEFSEVHQSKPQKEIDPVKLAEQRAQEELVATVATKRRAEKCIQKFAEDGLIPEDWDEHQLKDIAKFLPKVMFEDCRKEEPEVVAQVENFGKICAKLSMQYARELAFNH